MLALSVVFVMNTVFTVGNELSFAYYLDEIQAPPLTAEARLRFRANLGDMWWTK
jgi:hypothetical protein